MVEKRYLEGDRVEKLNNLIKPNFLISDIDNLGNDYISEQIKKNIDEINSLIKKQPNITKNKRNEIVYLVIKNKKEVKITKKDINNYFK